MVIVSRMSVSSSLAQNDSNRTTQSTHMINDDINTISFSNDTSTMTFSSDKLPLHLSPNSITKTSELTAAASLSASSSSSSSTNIPYPFLPPAAVFSRLGSKVTEVTLTPGYSPIQLRTPSRKNSLPINILSGGSGTHTPTSHTLSSHISSSPIEINSNEMRISTGHSLPLVCLPLHLYRISLTLAPHNLPPINGYYTCILHQIDSGTGKLRAVGNYLLTAEQSYVVWVVGNAPTTLLYSVYSNPLIPIPIVPTELDENNRVGTASIIISSPLLASVITNIHHNDIMRELTLQTYSTTTTLTINHVHVIPPFTLDSTTLLTPTPYQLLWPTLTSVDLAESPQLQQLLQVNGQDDEERIRMIQLQVLERQIRAEYGKSTCHNVKCYQNCSSHPLNTYYNPLSNLTAQNPSSDTHLVSASTTTDKISSVSTSSLPGEFKYLGSSEIKFISTPPGATPILTMSPIKPRRGSGTWNNLTIAVHNNYITHTSSNTNTNTNTIVNNAIVPSTYNHHTNTQLPLDSSVPVLTTPDRLTKSTRPNIISSMDKLKQLSL